ncbi:MAG: UDP-N-acetylglucosamine 2-epimerase (hydrolyzing) [Colwellia sp.]|nr:UDP-N-acetylglucosamine 2-epimerase (hydrolyzing) [Colwellia sp.]
MKKIAVFTGTRAEYGLLYWILKGLHEANSIDLQLLVGGSHLAHEFGHTIDNIEKDGFLVTERLDFLLSSDSPQAISKSLALAVIAGADCFARLKPDLLVLLGDRYECLALAQCAMLANIPIAHIHGGERTEGAVDDVIRHAISKMSHLHFTATKTYQDRVIQLGEHPSRVFDYGAPGLDNIDKLPLLSKKQLADAIEFPQLTQFFLVTYHPVTLSSNDAKIALDNLLTVLAEQTKFQILITFPNADAQGRKLIDVLKNFVSQYSDRVKLFESMGQLNYLSAMKHASLVIGNSSSGIIEAPSFQVPTINIGDRQKGRVSADSVFHCGESIEDIAKSITIALERKLKHVVNPYGKGGASEKIIEKLLTVKIDSLLAKSFYDIDINVND